jgi:hypothetical protein
MLHILRRISYFTIRTNPNQRVLHTVSLLGPLTPIFILLESKQL